VIAVCAQLDRRNGGSSSSGSILSGRATSLDNAYRQSRASDEKRAVKANLDARSRAIHSKIVTRVPAIAFLG
jgi:hypothetical protein